MDARDLEMTSKTVALALGLVLLPAAATAQVDVRVQIPLPTIRFEVPPPLVVVQEGVQVVPDQDDEVFVADGWYWYRGHDHWYRCRDHRGRWVVVERRYVPAALVKIPPGKYKRHKPHKHYRRHRHDTVYVEAPYGRWDDGKHKDRGGGRGKREKKGKGRWK
jgi:hypothetical protein